MPALKFSPKEILFGLIINTKPTPPELHSLPFMTSDTETHLAYAAQQCLNAHIKAIDHAISRKAAFDQKLIKAQGGPITFKQDELVQVL